MGTTTGSFYLSLYLRQHQVLFVDDPWSKFDHLRCRQSTLSDKSLHKRATHLQLACRCFLCYPVPLVLKGRDFVIVAQARYTRRIPGFLLSGLVTEPIQDSRDCFVLAYLRQVTHQVDYGPIFEPVSEIRTVG
jgi:hypothetical protein